MWAVTATRIVAGAAAVAVIGRAAVLRRSRFGRAFWAGFYVIGVVLIGGALAGAITGLAGGSAADIRAVTGLIAAADLSLASAWTVLQADRR